MIPKEILKQIRRIQITTSRMVRDVFSGQYQSVFKGRGIEFDEVRQYEVGDEIRSIDWNVTARMGHPYVKKFMEERELTVMLLLDLSGSIYFGTSGRLKRQLAAEICAVLALSAIRNNDRVGMIIFTDRIEKFIPPKKGLGHVLLIIREALYFMPQGKRTDIALALEYLNRVLHRTSVVFLVSDFYAPKFENALAVANKRHDLIGITITDPKEIELPNNIGIVQFEDAETGSLFFWDTSDISLNNAFKENSQRIIQERKRLFSRLGVDYIDIRSDRPYEKSLFAFFRMRERRLR